MATLKVVVLKAEGQTNSKGESNIKILLVHNGKNAYIKTNYYIDPTLMGTDGQVSKKHPNASWLNHNIRSELIKYEGKILELKSDVDSLSVQQLKEYLITDNSKIFEFFKYSQKRIAELKESGKKTWKIYSDSIDQFKKYAGREITFNEIDKRYLEQFETWLKTKGNRNKEEKNCSVNTISVYMRSIRTIYRSAMDEYNKEGKPPAIVNYPFKFYKIRSEETQKRNLSSDLIRKIKNYTPKNQHEEVARDMFILSFYLIGINTIDLFNLPPLSKDRIEYYREKVLTKSKRFYSIKVEPEIREIIEKHKGERYLLKYADNNQKYREEKGIVLMKGQRFFFQFNTHKDFQEMINSRMHDIAKELGINEKVTTYYARHSWATIASEECDITDDVIQSALGHKDPGKETTMIYINKSRRKVDEANRKVIDLINGDNNDI